MSNFNDAWDDLLFNPDRYEDDDGSYGPRPVRCKYCGAANVFWRENPEGKWRLLTMGSQKPHTCEAFRNHKERKDARH